jgi:hypothetical protein
MNKNLMCAAKAMLALHNVAVYFIPVSFVSPILASPDLQES